MGFSVHLSLNHPYQPSKLSKARLGGTVVVFVVVGVQIMCVLYLFTSLGGKLHNGHTKYTSLHAHCSCDFPIIHVTHTLEPCRTQVCTCILPIQGSIHPSPSAVTIPSPARVHFSSPPPQLEHAQWCPQTGAPWGGSQYSLSPVITPCVYLLGSNPV